jgi:hypothetical protein
MAGRVFLLSPASCSGNRARMLLSESSRLPLARALRAPAGAPIGEVFSFISQLYFRGKLTYARAFARVPAVATPHGLSDGVLVITTSRGLVPWDTPVTSDTLREFASMELAPGNEGYSAPLARGLRSIASQLGPEDEVVLLGSIATDKYLAVLMEALDGRLLFPREFVGRGDMSRGGLLLRCAREGCQLDYIPVAGSVRHGVRPPKLPRLTRAPGERLPPARGRG